MTWDRTLSEGINNVLAFDVSSKLSLTPHHHVYPYCQQPNDWGHTVWTSNHARQNCQLKLGKSHDIDLTRPTILFYGRAKRPGQLDECLPLGLTISTPHQRHRQNRMLTSNKHAHHATLWNSVTATRHGRVCSLHDYSGLLAQISVSTQALTTSFGSRTHQCTYTWYFTALTFRPLHGAKARHLKKTTEQPGTSHGGHYQFRWGILNSNGAAQKDLVGGGLGRVVFIGTETTNTMTECGSHTAALTLARSTK